LRKLASPEEAIIASSAFCGLAGLTIRDATRELFLDALEEMRRHRLKPRDALHAATMHAVGIRTIISEDPDFDNAPGIIRRSIEAFKLPA
jgi:predicted nucleic acid-binding protein